MSKIIREPLLHFLLLGAVMFGLFHLVGDEIALVDEPQKEIVISEGQIESLVLGFEKAWQRPPKPSEMDGLLEEFIREEIMYREALAMGLDRYDSVIRRHLQQKLEFLSEDLATLAVPDEDDLEAFLVANADRFLQQSKFSFSHIYFNTTERGAQALSDAEALLSRLAQGSIDDEMIANSGDPLLMIPSSFQNTRQQDIQRILGVDFSQSLSSLPTGAWQGPVESGFGLHLVYIDHFQSETLPSLNDIRDQVTNEWNSQKSALANEAFYRALRENYIVTLDNSNSEINRSVDAAVGQ